MLSPASHGVPIFFRCQRKEGHSKERKEVIQLCPSRCPRKLPIFLLLKRHPLSSRRAMFLVTLGSLGVSILASCYRSVVLRIFGKILCPLAPLNLSRRWAWVDAWFLFWISSFLFLGFFFLGVLPPSNILDMQPPTEHCYSWF